MALHNDFFQSHCRLGWVSHKRTREENGAGFNLDQSAHFLTQVKKL